MAFKFENLRVWKKALALDIRVRDLCKSFPSSERFVLTTQLLRASDSVCLNIAEGSTGHSDPEQKRFLIISRRSALETVGALIIARENKLATPDKINPLYSEYEELVIMLNSFIKSLS